MGMMNMAPAPQEMPQPAPEQGMMGGQPPQQATSPTLSHGQFNATVMVEGKPVEVKAGVAQVEGQPYMVSDDGKLVVDTKGRLVGHIEQDQFVPADEAYLKQMQDAGYVR